MCSVDEVACVLARNEPAVDTMRRVRAAVRDRLGPVLSVSLGVAPTTLLAKMAAESSKPCGTAWWPREALPEIAAHLPAGEVPGLGPAPAARLAAAGLRTFGDLWAFPPKRWRDVLGTVEGGRLALALQGTEPVGPPRRRRSFSHGHVLVPGEHDWPCVYRIARALVLEVLRRTRRTGCALGALRVSCGPVSVRVPLGSGYGERTALRAFKRAWRGRRGQGAPRGSVSVLGECAVQGRAWLARPRARGAGRAARDRPRGGHPVALGRRCGRIRERPALTVDGQEDCVRARARAVAVHQGGQASRRSGPRGCPPEPLFPQSGRL